MTKNATLGGLERRLFHFLEVWDEGDGRWGGGLPPLQVWVSYGQGNPARCEGKNVLKTLTLWIRDWRVKFGNVRKRQRKRFLMSWGCARHRDEQFEPKHEILASSGSEKCTNPQIWLIFFDFPFSVSKRKLFELRLFHFVPSSTVEAWRLYQILVNLAHSILEIWPKERIVENGVENGVGVRFSFSKRSESNVHTKCQFWTKRESRATNILHFTHLSLTRPHFCTHRTRKRGN